jgi:hypothetical protein
LLGGKNHGFPNRSALFLLRMGKIGHEALSKPRRSRRVR